MSAKDMMDQLISILSQDTVDQLFSMASPSLCDVTDRIHACLLGGALGDALGYTVEFDRWNAIRSEFGPDGIRNPVPVDGKARISDDTQMTLFTLEGMILAYLHTPEGEPVRNVEESLYQSYLCWLQTQGVQAKSRWDSLSELMKYPEMRHRRAPGHTCLSALRSGEMGSIQYPINHSKGCGGVMRTAPLGFFRGGESGENPFGSPLENGAKAAAITHGHPLGWIPAGMLSDLIYRCVYLSPRSLEIKVLDSLAATVEAYGSYEETKRLETLIHRAVELARVPVSGERETATVDEPAIRSLGEGWVGEEALAIAVYAALRYQWDFKGGLIAAVNHNGDSDSTGAIAGNILGAFLGRKALPEDWLSQLELTSAIGTLAGLAGRIISN